MDRLNAELQKLDEAGRLRTLSPAHGLDFTSNDYLGFRQHPALREAAQKALADGIDLGAGGSRLLRGNHPAHESLEHKAAAFFGEDRALYFSSGFLANYALITTLPARGDTIIYDALIHASLRDGIQANPAKHLRVAHNDLSAYEHALRVHAPAICWVVVESVYSMDGDLAPLEELTTLCEKYNAWLIVDEAHATGVFGPQGKGLTHTIDYDRMIVLHTCGKGLGVSGALLCGANTVIETLINRARPFIYSTAPMPLQAVLVERALDLCAGADAERETLFNLCKTAQAELGIQSPSPIFPYIIGGDHAAVEAAIAMQKQGFDLRAVRPPTVPENTARLRIALNASLTEKNICDMAAALRGLNLKAAA